MYEVLLRYCLFFFQAEDGIRDLVRSRGLGDVYKRQVRISLQLELAGAKIDQPRTYPVQDQVILRVSQAQVAWRLCRITGDHAAHDVPGPQVPADTRPARLIVLVGMHPIDACAVVGQRQVWCRAGLPCGHRKVVAGRGAAPVSYTHLTTPQGGLRESLVGAGTI